MKFELSEMRGGTVWSLYRMRDRIQLDPEYQRLSDIWTLDKRQLLVDTVINDFDIPKLYFHKFHEPLRKDGRSYDYAIIDGKQRLESIWAFIDGKFALANDFSLFKDGSVTAAGMKYEELGRAYPDLKVQFDSFPLSVICIETAEIEMIEEMFSRLNESAPLTAPEKRNAYGGPLPSIIRKLADQPLFTKNIPFPNKRYRHLDLATKFLLAEYENRVVDTKKAYLDRFVESFSSQSRSKAPAFSKAAADNVGRMAAIFANRDPLLRQVGMVVLYYHLFRFAHQAGWTADITRHKLLQFEQARDQNRRKAERDIARADYDLLEFDRYAQSPNDAYAIRLRLKILLHRVFKKDVQTDDL